MPSAPVPHRSPRSLRIHRPVVVALACLSVLTVLAAPVTAGAGPVIPTTTAASTAASSPTTGKPATPAVVAPATPAVSAYWVVASDGGVFSFGGAPFYGSTGNIRLNQPMVAITATSPTDTSGYREVAADGGIFDYGDAGFYGSTGGERLVQPIVAMAPSHSHHGYWMVAADGGVFAFGDAGFYGSLGGVPQPHPIVSMTTTADGRGYWFTNSNGAVTAFGDATYWGSTPQVLAAPVVGIASARGTGSFTGSSYPSGSTGYDISNYQCGGYPPAPHTIGVVQVVGESFGPTNPCLAGEAAWAGGGLNLYMYLTFGEAAGSGDAACAVTADPAACNYGFDAALDAFAKARSVGITTAVPWWLDVESAVPGIPGWSTNLAANAGLVQGTLDGLHAEGLNSVGIYASPGVWPHIVGNYQPAVPYWAADWGIDPAVTCGNIHSLWPGLPTGPVQLVQYGVNPINGVRYDDDYAC